MSLMLPPKSKSFKKNIKNHPPSPRRKGGRREDKEGGRSKENRDKGEGGRGEGSNAILSLLSFSFFFSTTTSEPLVFKNIFLPKRQAVLEGF